MAATDSAVIHVEAQGSLWWTPRIDIGILKVSFLLLKLLDAVMVFESKVNCI